MANMIISSLEKDIPVVFASNMNSEVQYQGVNVNRTGQLGSHFVTITGIKVDTITEERTLIISTWSYMATISLNDFYDQGGIGSRVIILE